MRAVLPMEEREGFEPSEPYGSPDFESYARKAHRGSHRAKSCAPCAESACRAPFLPDSPAQRVEGFEHTALGEAVCAAMALR